MEPATEEACAAPSPQTLPANTNLGSLESAPSPASGPAANASHSHNGTPSPPDKHTAKERPISGVVPPYWGHYRNASRSSQASLDQSRVITLVDHSEDPNSDTSRGLWAKSVAIEDYVIVKGKSGIGAYVVWNCKIQTLEVRDVPRTPSVHSSARFISDSCPRAAR